MHQAAIALTRAPVALAPAVRLVEPALLQPPQDPLLPWPVPADQALQTPQIPDDVQRVVGNLAAAMVEVLCGARSPAHLEPHTSPEVHQLLGHLRRALALGSLRLASLHLSQPGPGIVEAAARLTLGHHSRAAALCFTAHGERWRLCHLELSLEPAVILRSG